MRYGTNIVRDAARSKAPVYTGEVSQGHPPPGTLKKSIFTKLKNSASTPTTRVWQVFVRQGKQFQNMQARRSKDFVGPLQTVNRDAYYWRFVEFGTAKMSARPFMRPAFNAKRKAALDAIGLNLWLAISTKTKG
jgi:HK97 gp10 family phage protein